MEEKEEKAVDLLDRIQDFFSASPAPEWQWTGIGLAILGVILGIIALPTFLQMLFSKPKISVDFKDSHLEGGKYLRCFVKNEGIYNKFLLLIGVQRQDAKVICSFSIYEDNTSRIIVDTEAIDKSFRTVVSSWPAVLPIIYLENDSDQAMIHCFDEDRPIPRGYYKTEMQIMCLNGGSLRVTKRFQVGDKPTELFWSN